MKKLLVLLSLCLSTSAQLADTQKLKIGTNVGGISDWGTELPFVDLMHNSREWFTKDVGNWEKWNTETADSIQYRPDGYPTYMPQMVPGHSFPQKVATIWAITDGWLPGTYTVLFKGSGTLAFSSAAKNVQKITANHYTFDFTNPVGNSLEMSIDSSSSADPVHSIQVLMPNSLSTYQTNPFNPAWIAKLKPFSSARFMDWGQTNGWGETSKGWNDSTLFTWDTRQKMDNYTWATNKGIPYEMMISLMNTYDIDGWVCVPHRADSAYIHQMAELFHKNLEPERTLTVEYSNEIWNWMFGQTQWLNTFGCVKQGKIWPEGTVPYIQKCMDIWTKVYGADSRRIVRTVGVQTAWGDVSRRIVHNLRPGSFDAVSPAFYFGIGQTADSILDSLGSKATVADIARLVRKDREINEKVWIAEIKKTIADSLKIPMKFYEGGQHLTPTPFGTEPTYAQALLDIQRDTTMYNLYMEWFEYLKTLQSGNTPLELMNFSFIGGRSARYGSWGILETMHQDTSLVFAPKYKAIMETIAKKDQIGISDFSASKTANVEITFSRRGNTLSVHSAVNQPIHEVSLFTIAGRKITTVTGESSTLSVPLQEFGRGVYIVAVKVGTNRENTRVIQIE